MIGNVRLMFTTRQEYMGGKFVWYKDAGRDNVGAVLNGNLLLNPFKLGGFLMAGDLFEYRLAHPTKNPTGGGYLLKVWKLKEAKGASDDELVFDAMWSHVIEAGDRIMVAPATATATGKFATVVSVEADSAKMEYKVKISTEDATGLGAVVADKLFVEAGEGIAGASVNVLVKNPNSFVVANRALDVPTNGAHGISDVTYEITTVTGERVFDDMCTPIPPYVMLKNRSYIEGLFEV